MKQDHCECGAGIRLLPRVNSLGESVYDSQVWDLWQLVHADHERISAPEANRIRDYAKRKKAPLVRQSVTVA